MTNGNRFNLITLINTMSNWVCVHTSTLSSRVWFVFSFFGFFFSITLAFISASNSVDDFMLDADLVVQMLSNNNNQSCWKLKSQHIWSLAIQIHPSIVNVINSQWTKLSAPHHSHAQYSGAANCFTSLSISPENFDFNLYSEAYGSWSFATD